MSANVFAQHALQLLDLGYSPVPLKSDRNPLSLHNVRPGRQWNSLRTEPLSRAEIDTISSYRWPVGIGVAGGFDGLVPADIDTDDRGVFAAIAKVLPKPIVWRKGSKGGLTFLRTEDASLLANGIKFLLPSGKPLVEILTTGVATIPPTMHPKIRDSYRWLTDPTLLTVPASDHPIITAEHVPALRQALSPWCPPPKVYTPPPTKVDRTQVSETRYETYAKTCLENAVAELSRMSAGRNWALFGAVSFIGKFVANGVIDEREVMSALMDACRANGYMTKPDAGPRKCESSIRSGSHVRPKTMACRLSPIGPAARPSGNRPERHASRR